MARESKTMATTPTDTRTSRILGALLGVHCGDSLGATFEFRPWSSISQQYPHGLREIIGGGSFQWPAGHATDDTDLTRAVLLAYRDSIRARRNGEANFNLAKAAAEYALKWYEGEWPGRKLGQRPDDIGGATRNGIRNFKIRRDASKSGAGVGSAGNGSLMRCIPTALFTDSLDLRVKESMAISEFTHDDPRCTVACAAYNEIAAALIAGKTVNEAVEIGRGIAKDLDEEEVVNAIQVGQTLSLARMATEAPRKSGFSPSGYVIHSLQLSIAALLDSRSFEDVLVDVVRLGGDSDTNGAIAGGLVGARDGLENMPERWLEKLQFREEFEELAREILRMQEGGEEGLRHEEEVKAYILAASIKD